MSRNICADVQVAFGCRLGVEAQVNGVLLFRRVAMRSPWRHCGWVLRKANVESAPFEAFQQAIEAHRGVWERVFGGVFFAHLPPDTDFDPEAALDQVIAQQTSERTKHSP